MGFLGPRSVTQFGGRRTGKFLESDLMLSTKRPKGIILTGEARTRHAAGIRPQHAASLIASGHSAADKRYALAMLSQSGSGLGDTLEQPIEFHCLGY